MADHLAWWIRTIFPISSFSFLPTRRVHDLSQRPIVVIGCDSGIARKAVEFLSKELKITKIYAGCFTEKALHELPLELGCETFQIDVRDIVSVERAGDFIRKREPNGVFAVANAAGAMMGGPIEWTSLDVFKAEIELNYFGLLHVAKVFLPMLKTYFRYNSNQRTRFIAITSTIAVMPSFPGLSGYAASKSAAETLMNTLRLEVHPFGVDVLTVCPGITRTPFLTNGSEQMRRAWQTAPDRVKDEYGQQYADWWIDTMQFGIDWLAHDPSDAINCLVESCTAQWPKTRYFCGLDARILARPAVHAPDFMWDGVLRTLFAMFGEPGVNSRRARL